MPSDHPAFGWGGSGGRVYQKAYVEFFASESLLDQVLETCAACPSLNYYAVSSVCPRPPRRPARRSRRPAEAFPGGLQRRGAVTIESCRAGLAPRVAGEAGCFEAFHVSEARLGVRGRWLPVVGFTERMGGGGRWLIAVHPLPASGRARSVWWIRNTWRIFGGDANQSGASPFGGEIDMRSHLRVVQGSTESESMENKICGDQ